ncbi:MAG: alternative ribosome rescue aminoacyl-tRNA hydrolase ArfB [Anaerolineaceae bacterium]
MIEITSSIKIDESELQFDFIRASGPGGQNVNKVATAAQLRWDVRATAALPEEVKTRLLKIASNRITEEGVLIIEAKRFRTQEQNRLDALRRLTVLVQQALEQPRVRKPTRPSVTARAARVGEKKKHGEIKRFRRYDPDEWE